MSTPLQNRSDNMIICIEDTSAFQSSLGQWKSPTMIGQQW